MLFSGDTLETGSIHNSGYWKIAGLTACYFQGNSWKLGASIIRVIGKQQAQQPAIFRGTLRNLGLPLFRLLENSRPNSLLFSSELLETSHLFHSGYWKIVGLRHAIFRGALGIFRAESFHMQLLFSYEINHTVQKLFVLIFLIYLINQNILSMFQKKKKF